MDNPTPDNYEGGGDFTIVRSLDGHVTHPDPKVGRNAYDPQEDSMGGYDEAIEPNVWEV